MSECFGIMSIPPSASIVSWESIVILNTNHKIRVNIMRCLRNSTVRREIGQLCRTFSASDYFSEIEKFHGFNT